MRLDRFLSGQAALSRKEAAEAIRNGGVTVNGTAIRKPDTQITEGKDRITLSGKPIVYEVNCYFLLHKPEGVITATRDSKQQTVMDLLAPEDRRKGLFPSGRLDLDTAGLLLITDDGKLSHQMLSPKHHVAKYYLAALRDDFSQSYISAFRSGILLREGAAEEACLPAECDAIGKRLAVLELHEGKYHQVRRMFAAVGNHVEHLLRVQIGSLQLPPDLAAGSYLKVFNKDAVSALKDSSVSQVCAFCAQHYSSYWIKSGK